VGWRFTWRRVSFNGESGGGGFVQGAVMLAGQTPPQDSALLVKMCLFPVVRTFTRNPETMDRVELQLAPGERITSVTGASQAGHPRLFEGCFGCCPSFHGCWPGIVWPAALGYLHVKTSTPGKTLTVGRLIHGSAPREIPHRPDPSARVFGFKGKVGGWLDNLSVLL